VGAYPADKYDLVGKPAPDLVARGLTGENVRISEHRGEVVVVSFWSGSCNTCRAQLNALDRIAKTYASAGLTVIGVNLDDDAARAEKVRARPGGQISPADIHPREHRARLPRRPPADDGVRRS
jgi:thiol-disulfide isomerase/thioredoxin